MPVTIAKAARGKKCQKISQFYLRLKGIPLEPEKMDLVRRWVLANKKHMYYRNYKVLATGIDEIVAPNPPITCPTLVLTSDKDYGNGPEMSEAIAAEIPSARLVILQGLRHMALMENPEAVNQPIMVFLQNHV